MLELNRYASVGNGSAVDQGCQWERRMDGMIPWKFGLVMGCLPLRLSLLYERSRFKRYRRFHANGISPLYSHHVPYQTVPTIDSILRARLPLCQGFEPCREYNFLGSRA